MKARPLVIRFAACALALCAVLWIWRVMNPTAEDVMNRVPLGSRLVDLDGLVGQGVTSGDVIEWVPTGRTASADDTDIAHDPGAIVRFGGKEYVQESRGSYDTCGTAKERERFTGEIMFFYHEGSLWSVEIIGFIYVDGLLRKRQWGYLPG